MPNSKGEGIMISDITKPLREYVEQKVNYFHSLGLKNDFEIGKQSAYDDILERIKKLEWNGKI